MVKWILECDHTVTCGCRHFVGQFVYCTKHNKYVRIKRWEQVE